MDEAREKGKKGGIKSGESRRERKKFKEALIDILSEGDTQDKILVALVKQAQRGNIKAFEVLRDTIGENPDKQDKNNPELNNKINDNIIAIAELIRNPLPNRELPEDGETE